MARSRQCGTKTLNFTDDFTLDARNVILSAGSLGTPEILLRSEMKGLVAVAEGRLAVFWQRRLLRDGL